MLYRNAIVHIHLALWASCDIELFTDILFSFISLHFFVERFLTPFGLALSGWRTELFMGC